MKILHILYDDPRNPWLGGSGAVRAFEVNLRLAAAGHEITVVTGNFPKTGTEERHPGIRFLRTGSGESYLRSRLTYTHGAEMLIHAVSHDLLVHDISPFHPVRSRAISSAPAIGLVRHVAGLPLLYRYPLLGVMAWIWERRLIRSFDFLLADSPRARDRARPLCRPGATLAAISGDSADNAPDWDDLARQHARFYRMSITVPGSPPDSTRTSHEGSNGTSNETVAPES